MTRRQAALLTLLLGFAPAGSLADLRGDMGEQQFRQAGLHKLDADELAALETWLHRGEAPEADAGSSASGGVLQRFGLRPSQVAPVEPEAIEARIDGEFKGWSGRTLFRLDNGQIWQQRTRDNYYRPMQSPAVRISKATMGYRLEIIETGASTGVKRVR